MEVFIGLWLFSMLIHMGIVIHEALDAAYIRKQKYAGIITLIAGVIFSPLAPLSIGYVLNSINLNIGYLKLHADKANQENHK